MNEQCLSNLFRQALKSLTLLILLLTVTYIPPVKSLKFSFEEVELIKNGDFSSGLLYWSLNNTELFSVVPFRAERSHKKYGDLVLEFRVDSQKARARAHRRFTFLRLKRPHYPSSILITVGAGKYQASV